MGVIRRHVGSVTTDVRTDSGSVTVQGGQPDSGDYLRRNQIEPRSRKRRLERRRGGGGKRAQQSHEFVE